MICNFMYISFIYFWCAWFLLAIFGYLSHAHFSFAQTSTSLSPYVIYVDGSSHYARHIASATWVLYTHDLELLSSRGSFLGHTTNNIFEYMFVIELFMEIIYLEISNLVLKLGSHLVVMHLSNHYNICNLILLHHFLRIRLFEHHF